MTTIIFADGEVWLGDAWDRLGILITSDGLLNYDLGYKWVNLEGK